MKLLLLWNMVFGGDFSLCLQFATPNTVGDPGQSDYTGCLPAHAANMVHLLMHGCLSVVVGTGDNQVKSLL